MKIFQTCIRTVTLLAVALLSANAIAADLPPLPQGLSAPSAATKLSAFNLPTAAGGTMKTDDYKGKVIVARFWATW